MFIKTNAANRILSMSFTRSRAEDKISSMDDMLAIHILRVLLYPTSTYAVGWRKEIRNWLFKASECGNNLKDGKKLKSIDYLNFLALPVRSVGSTMIMKDIMISKMGLIKSKLRKVDDDILFAKIQHLYIEIANFLVTNPEPSEVQKFVDNIKL